MSVAMTPAVRETLSTALVLVLFSVVGSALLAGTYTSTHETIARSEQAVKMALVAQTLPPGSFDNNPIQDARPLAADPLLGLRHGGLAYPARQAGATTGVVLEAAAPDGYSGEIRLLVGIQADGRISGVRVTAHRETPGLGDYIDIAKNDWIRQFEGKSADNPAPESWKVRKDGGSFDSLAGATITPRAVVKAVRKALDYFTAHKTELLAPASAPAGIRLEDNP